MRLVEKKCPNCGGSLKFNYEDTETKCEFCGRCFEIERDNNITDDNDEIFNASNYKLTEEQKKAFTAVAGAFAATQVIPIIIFAVVFIGIVGFGIFRSGLFGNPCSNCINEFSEIDKDFVEDIHEKTEKTLREQASFTSFKDPIKSMENVGMYIEVAKKSFSTFYDNSIIDVYKITYNGDKEYYGAIRYKDLKEVDGKITLNFDGEVLFPLKSEGTDIYYGYTSLKDLYNSEIRSNLEKYKVISTGDVYGD